jgi:hypothetical protein
MKKCLFVLIGIIFFISCRDVGKLVDEKKSSSYFINSDRQILYCQSGNWFELGIDTMKADAKSFKIISNDIAEDKNFVFYKGGSQKQVDRNSFYIENEIPKDRFHAYYTDNALGFKIIEGADSKTFEYLNGNNTWARDKDHYFYDWLITHVDRKSFAFINDIFSEDKDSIYVAPDVGKLQSVLPNKGGAKAINNQYMKIGRTVYYAYSHPNLKLMTNSFDTISQTRVIDKNIICVNNQVIISYGKKFKYRNVDINSFQVYPPDKEQKTQDDYSNDLYSKDRDNVYYDGEIIPGADVKTFTLLKFDFGKDAKHAYYKTELLKGVDVQSFEEADTVYKDKLGNRFHYWTGKKL